MKIMVLNDLADERSEGGKVRGAAPYAPPEVDGRR